MNPQSPSWIPHSSPFLGQEEIDRVSAVIASGLIAQGAETAAFEAEFARLLAMEDAVAVSSGTAALHLTLRAMDIGPGDEVVMPSYVCTALLNAVHYVGAEPVIADVFPETGNIDPDDVKQRITARTRAVIVPHIFGLPAELDGLLSLGPPIIEDCAQAVGAHYHNRPVGTLGYAAVFSFYATKVMTTGEGGMVASADAGLLSGIRDLAAYDNRPAYQVRYNYKMTDIQAAMGRVQLSRLRGMNRRRAVIAARYDETMHGLPMTAPPRTSGRIYYRYVAGAPEDPDAWIKRLAARGVGCARPVFQPLHRYLKRTGYPGTEAAWGGFLSLPVYPGLSDPEAGRVVQALYG